MDKDLIGKITHYYDKIGVAIIKLSQGLKVGDKVKFVKSEETFEQVIESIQLEHASIPEGKKGQEVGVKVNQEVKEGTLVYQV